MNKTIKFSQQARQDLIDGVNIVAEAVKATLGAKGRNVVIRRPSGDIHITKDGVTVAEEIFLEDKAKDVGAQIIKQAAKKTANEAGDGTTTATVLAQYLVNQGSKNIAAGATPTELNKGIHIALDAIKEQLKKMAVPVKDNLTNIATISANNDAVLGGVIADAFEAVGEDGVVTMERSKDSATYFDVSEGVEYSGGLASPYFINNTRKMVAQHDNPLFLVTEHEIGDIKDLLQPNTSPIEFSIKQSRPIIIICEEMYGSAMDSILQNHLEGRLKAAVVSPPSFGEDRKMSLEDIAIVTGAKFVSKESGIRLNEITPDMLGSSEKVIVNNKSISIIRAHGNTDAIEARKQEIRDGIEALDDKSKKDQYKQRLAKLQSGVATVYVGAETEVELREKVDRADDAIQATRAAIEEGVVCGGGVALIRAMQSVTKPKNVSGDIETGWKILLSSCEQPLRAIVHNAGVEGSVVVGKVKDNKDNYGYNAKTETYEKDLMKSGVVDPVKVTRTALNAAVSVASMVLMTEVSIVDEGDYQSNTR